MPGSNSVCKVETPCAMWCKWNEALERIKRSLKKNFYADISHDFSVHEQWTKYPTDMCDHPLFWWRWAQKNFLCAESFPHFLIFVVAHGGVALPKFNVIYVNLCHLSPTHVKAVAVNTQVLFQFCPALPYKYNTEFIEYQCLFSPVIWISCINVLLVSNFYSQVTLIPQATAKSS